MNNKELFDLLSQQLGIIKNTNYNIYVLNYGNAFYKLILALPPFNINEFHNDFFSPFIPTLDMTIFNASQHMLNILLEQLQHTPNNQYVTMHTYDPYIYIWININHYVNTVLYNIYTMSLINNNDNIIVKFYNNYTLNTDNTNTINNIANNTLPINTLNTDPIANTINNDLNNLNNVNNIDNNVNNASNINNNNNTLPINTLNTANTLPIVPINTDTMEKIKNIDIALYIWFDKYVIIEPTAYINKKDAYTHYKNTAIANMLEPMKLQEFYNAMKLLNITTDRINNTSSFVGVKLK